MVEIEGFPLVPWDVYTMPKDKGGLVWLMLPLWEYSSGQVGGVMS
jgi:hypothetical protein